MAENKILCETRVEMYHYRICVGAPPDRLFLTIG